MTEAGWLNSTNPQTMLSFLRDSGKLSDRKARLFAAACCRRIWHLLTDERSRRAVEVAERYAEGIATEEERAASWRLAYFEVVRVMPPDGQGVWAAVAAERAVLAKYQQRSWWKRAATTAEAATLALADDSGVQAALLRDLFGPLAFRPVSVPSSVRAWNHGFIVKLATAIYEERAMPEGTLDSLRLGVLADALEEAGVTDPDLLGHLRQHGAVHVRGCFVLDLLLGKE